MAKYVSWHVSCHNGNHDNVLLPAESCREIHENVDGGPYGYGWFCGNDRGWAGGKTCMHIGSNNLFYYIVWLALGEDEHVSRAYVAFANEGYAFSMTDQAVWAAIQARFEGNCTELTDSWPAPVTPSPAAPLPSPTPAPFPYMSFSISFDLGAAGEIELLDEDELFNFGQSEFGRGPK